MARIFLPTPLRPYAGQQPVVEVEAATVGEALRALVERHGGLRRHLYDDEGRLRRFVNVFRNEEDVRHLERENTPLGNGDTITIDAKTNRIDLEVDAAELARRRARFRPPPLKATRGTLAKYIRSVRPASAGCVTDE